MNDTHRVEAEMGWCDEHDLPVDKWQNHCRQGELRWYVLISVGDRVSVGDREYDCQVVRGWFIRCLHSALEVCEMQEVRS